MGGDTRGAVAPAASAVSMRCDHSDILCSLCMNPVMRFALARSQGLSRDDISAAMTLFEATHEGISKKSFIEGIEVMQTFG